MAREAPRAGVGPLVARVAPKLDIIQNGSTDVNVCRAAQSGSVATRSRRAPRSVRLLTREEITALVRARTGDEPPPDVDVSLFVELSEDLDPDARRAARTRVSSIARNARWKLNTGAVQVRGTRLEELQNVRGVSYIEPGQTLRGPEPAVGGVVKKPDAALRRVSAQARRHGYGRDVLVGIIDVGGFDFAHADFLAEGGKTRWVAIWDQGGTSRPPPAQRDGTRFASLDYGAEILKEHMDRAIAAAPGLHMAAASLEPQSSMVLGSHGTHVASIAAGNLGVARNAHLAGVLVALRPEDTLVSSSFYDSTRIAHAVDYLMALAAELGGEDGPLPLAINISLGTNGHAHDTSSAMARWIDNALATPGRCVTVAAGNAGQVEPSSPPDGRPLTGRIHAGGTIAATGLRQDLGWVVADGPVADVSENEMEIWYGPQDRISVEVRPPGGAWIGPYAPGEHARNRGARQRDRAEHPQRDLSPRQRREPDLDRAEPVLRPGPRRRAPDRPDRGRRVAGAPHRHRHPRRPLRRLDRARRPAPRRRSGRAQLALPVVLRARQLHRRPHDQLARLRGADPRGGQRRRRPQCGPRHVEPRPDARRPLQARRRRRRYGHRRRPRARRRAAVDRDDRHEHGQPVRLRCRGADARDRARPDGGAAPGHRAQHVAPARRPRLHLAQRHRLRRHRRGRVRRGGAPDEAQGLLRVRRRLPAAHVERRAERADRRRPQRDLPEGHLAHAPEPRARSISSSSATSTPTTSRGSCG